VATFFHQTVSLKCFQLICDQLGGLNVPRIDPQSDQKAPTVVGFSGFQKIDQLHIVPAGYRVLIMYGKESIAVEAVNFRGLRDREAEPSMMAKEVDFA